MKGTVFSIEEFSVYDGPGIRTSVFLKGCPLRCSWCHNPEGQRAEAEIVRSPNGCIHCGACEGFARKTSGGIAFTQRSIEVCPNNLLRVCGEELEVQALCSRVLKNQNILRNGGVTFSGGEPLMQAPFLLECLHFLKGKLHTAVQTCGYADADTFARVLDAADYFLFDLKLMDEQMHRHYTGVSNRSILQNFRTLAQRGKPFVVRIPLIPGVTDTEENITQIAALLSACGLTYAECMSYNPYAGGKYAMVGRVYAPGFDETAKCNPRSEIFERFGIEAKLF